MTKLKRQLTLAPLLLLLAAPLAASGAERAVAAPEKAPEEAALLLPAVQKAQEPAPGTVPAATPARSVSPAPQKGIEPDEIDARNQSRAPSSPRPQASPAARPAPAAAARPGQKLSVQQMMVRLKPRQPMTLAAAPAGSTGTPGNVQAKPAEPPKYEIADCGTATSPMICCHHEAGDGSSCNLFKILCGNAGGTAQGDGESAACSDW
jgi:hypothetical protein